MNRASGKKERAKRLREDPWQQKIERARKAKNRLRAAQRLEPTTVSPVESMTAAYTAAGWFFRAVVMFLGVCSLTLFFCDAVAFTSFSGVKTDGPTVEPRFIALWSAAVAAFYSLAGLTKPSRRLAPFAVIGAFAAYLFANFSAPVDYARQSLRYFADLAINNLAKVGYTTYLQYAGDGNYAYPEEGMLRFVLVALILLFGSLLCVSMDRRVHPAPIALISALFFVPVFTFNLTRSNTPLAMTLVFLCGAIALYLYDYRFAGILAAKKATKKERAERKSAKKAKKRAEKEEKQALRRSALLAYSAATEAGLNAAEAIKAKNAVYERAEKEKAAAKKAATLQKQNERRATREAKKAAVLAADEAKKRYAEEKKRYRAALAAVKKAKGDVKEVKTQFFAEKRAVRAKKRAAYLARLKTTAAGGYAGMMAAVVAFLAVSIPTAAIDGNFPIIDVINNKMQLARTYVTAYLMGDDVDLNSLALYGGVAELNPRTVNFDTPQYTGQRLFRVESGYAAPVYLRSWIGTVYDTDTDSWLSADAEQVIAYRERFGSSYTSDAVSYYFNKYVYPNSVDITKYDQYRNLDVYGFRVFQVNVTRISGNSKLLFVPSIMNTGLGIMERGSIEPVSMKYSAYYDGIYSSRFFLEGTSYSTSSFVPVMKAENLGENLEGSILYYNLAKKYCAAVDQIEAEITGNRLFDEEKEYVYETSVGTFSLVGTDLGFLDEAFLAELASLTDYSYKGDSLVGRYIAMTAAERRVFRNAYAAELNYRDYAEETYTASFGLESVSELAERILAEAGIARVEKPSFDKSFMEGMTDAELRRLTAEEKYGNDYESWFTDTEGNTVPRHDVVMTVIQYLRDNYEYTLTPETEMTELLDKNGDPVLDEDGNPVLIHVVASDTNLEAFLFEVKQGYCVHFATAAVAILRELGFAVRYDEGYIASGFVRTYDTEAVSTYRTSVRDYDAHSWIEAYYPSIGWVPYETTPEYAPDMYDVESSGGSATSTGINPGKVTVKTEEPTPEEEDLTVAPSDEEEIDYTSVAIACGVALGLAFTTSLVVAWLKRRATKAANRRKEWIDCVRNEEVFYSESADVREAARKIADSIFEIFEGMGVPHQTGELPSEYAKRLSEDYNELSRRPIVEVMRIIEKEEFGGRPTFRERVVLGDYLEDITSSIYAGLSAPDRVRMRYFRNIV